MSKTTETRLCAILGGGDWADASVEHLVIPTAMDLESERRAYWEWYKASQPYKSFTTWLKDRGARDATCDDIECITDCL